MLFTVLASLVLEGARICGIQQQPTSVEDCKRICIENGCAGFTHFPNNNTCIFFASIRGAMAINDECPKSYLFSDHGRCRSEYGGYSKCMDNVLVKSTASPSSTIESKFIPIEEKFTFDSLSKMSNITRLKEENFPENVNTSAVDQFSTSASKSILSEDDVNNANVLPSLLDQQPTTIDTDSSSSIREDDGIADKGISSGNINNVEKSRIPVKEILPVDESTTTSTGTPEDISDFDEALRTGSINTVGDNGISSNASHPEETSIYDENVEPDSFSTVVDTSVLSSVQENITVIDESLIPIDSTSEKAGTYVGGTVYGNVSDVDSTAMFSIPDIPEEDSLLGKVTVRSNITVSGDTSIPSDESAATKVDLPKEATGPPSATTADYDGVSSNIITAGEIGVLDSITASTDISIVNDSGSTSSETSVPYNATSDCGADCIGNTDSSNNISTSKEVSIPSKVFASSSATIIDGTGMSSNISSQRGGNITDALSTTTTTSQESIVRSNATVPIEMNETRSIITPQPTTIVDNVTASPATNKSSIEDGMKTVAQKSTQSKDQRNVTTFQTDIADAQNAYIREDVNASTVKAIRQRCKTKEENFQYFAKTADGTTVIYTFLPMEKSMYKKMGYRGEKSRFSSYFYRRRKCQKLCPKSHTFFVLSNQDMDNVIDAINAYNRLSPAKEPTLREYCMGFYFIRNNRSTWEDGTPYINNVWPSFPSNIKGINQHSCVNLNITTREPYLGSCYVEYDLAVCEHRCKNC